MKSFDIILLAIALIITLSIIAQSAAFIVYLTAIIFITAMVRTIN